MYIYVVGFLYIPYRSLGKLCTFVVDIKTYTNIKI